MIIDCTHFVAGIRDGGPLSLGDAGRLARQTEGFVWVALSDPDADELDELGAAFGIERTDLAGTSVGFQRPKLEHHGQTTVLTVKTVCVDGAATPIRIGTVDIFVGGRFAIAIGQSNAEVLDGATERLATRTEVAEHGPVAAAWAVLDAVIQGSEQVVDVLGDHLESIQVAVFEGDEDQSEPIYLQIQEAGHLARAMHPMLTILDRLERGELVEAPEAMSTLLYAISDRARRLSEEMRMLGEALEGLLNANLARVNVRQNVILQKVSAWAAIAAVATIITGIYGMNFRHMPELDWVFGYPLSIAMMILIVVTLRWSFKRSGWL